MITPFSSGPTIQTALWNLTKNKFSILKPSNAFLLNKSMSITATIALEASDDVLIERLVNRGKTSARVDDQDEIKIRNRFNEYNNKTASLKSFYIAQGKFYSVNGIGSVEEITNRLTGLIDGLL